MISMSLADLMESLINSTFGGNVVEKQVILGSVAILLGVIVRQQNQRVLRAALRAIAQAASVPDAKVILATSRTGLTADQEAWYDDQLIRISHGTEPEESDD